MYSRILMLVVALALVVTPVLAQTVEPMESEIYRIADKDAEHLNASEQWCSDRFRASSTHLKFHYPGSGPSFLWRFSAVSMVRDDTKSVPTTKRTPGVGIEIRMSLQEYNEAGGEVCLNVPLTEVG